MSCQDFNLVEFSSKLLEFTADALAEFKLPPAESKSLMFINVQRQLLQSIGTSLTLQQAIKTSENLNSMLVPGLLSGSRVDNVAVCASIVNLLALLGRKILYDPQLDNKQEQIFSEQLWNIAGGLLQLQTRSASPGFKISAFSDVSFLIFDFYRVDSTSQRGNNNWTFSSTSQRKELGATFSIRKSVVSDTTLLDVIVVVQEFAWKTSDPHFLTFPASNPISLSKKFTVLGGVYGLKLFDISKGYAPVETLNPCMHVSISFDSLKVRQWVPQQRFAKVSIASYNSTSMMYNSDTCQTLTVGQDYVKSCCNKVSQYAVKVTPDATICGDGFADVENGEQCDDGNLVDGDGCDKICVIEKFYKCERSIPDICTIVPANVTEKCIPPSTCNGHGLYRGGSACICEPTYFRADCSLKLTPLSQPTPLQNGITQVLAEGLQFSMTSIPIIPTVTIAVFNDSDIQERVSFRENGQSGETLHSTQLQYEFNPPIVLNDSILSIKLNVSGFQEWFGNPMFANGNHSFFCRKLGACLWTRMRSSITSDYNMQVTISSKELPTIQRCAVFDFIPAYVPVIPGPVDNSSLLVVYIGSGLVAACLIAYFARRKYKQRQTANANVQSTLPVHFESVDRETITPSKPSSPHVGSASAEDRQLIQSSPRELIDLSDLNLDVDLLDDTILTTIMRTQQLPASVVISPVAPSRTMSQSPSFGQDESRRPISPPAAPRTPDGRRRPKVKSPWTSDIQNNADVRIFAETTGQEKLRASKSLSPTDRLTSKPLSQSVPPIARHDLQRRSAKLVATAADIQPAPISKGNRTLITGISPPPKVSKAANASKNIVTSGVSRIQRSRILRDADDDLLPPGARAGLSDDFIEIVPKPIASSVAPSSLMDRSDDQNVSGIFRSKAFDIESTTSSR
jgi:cysteine-rich repeat protein